MGLEDLHVKGMFKNRKLARALADAGLGQLLQFFETKMQAVGGQAIYVDRFFPSTKMCSGCGHRKKRMPLRIPDLLLPEMRLGDGSRFKCSDQLGT